MTIILTSRFRILLCVAAILSVGPLSEASAEIIALAPSKDNTLFQYVDPAVFNSNGSGNFFAAGKTNGGQIQRGLIQFDLSGLPADAIIVPGSAQLKLYVVDKPRQDTQATRPFWLVRLEGLNQAWGEGASKSDLTVSGGGGGSGVRAEPNDATWYHTQYDPQQHGVPEDEDFSFRAGEPGFWSQLGALGNDPVDALGLYGDPAGWAGDNFSEALFAGSRMEADLAHWLANPSSNFGWIVLGDESQNASKRGFASREHANVAFHPVLTFELREIPEPASIVLFALGLAVATLAAHRNAQRR
jgi:hypothetical protein